MPRQRVALPLSSLRFFSAVIGLVPLLAKTAIMLIHKKNRKEVYKYLFQGTPPNGMVSKIS